MKWQTHFEDDKEEINHKKPLQTYELQRLITIIINLDDDEDYKMEISLAHSREIWFDVRLMGDGKWRKPRSTCISYLIALNLHLVFFNGKKIYKYLIATNFTHWLCAINWWRRRLRGVFLFSFIFKSGEMIFIDGERSMIKFSIEAEIYFLERHWASGIISNFHFPNNNPIFHLNPFPITLYFRNAS